MKIQCPTCKHTHDSESPYEGSHNEPFINIEAPMIQCPVCKHVHDPFYPGAQTDNEPFLRVGDTSHILFLPVAGGLVQEGHADIMVCPICGSMRMVGEPIPNMQEPEPISWGRR